MEYTLTYEEIIYWFNRLYTAGFNNGVGSTFTKGVEEVCKQSFIDTMLEIAEEFEYMIEA